MNKKKTRTMREISTKTVESTMWKLRKSRLTIMKLAWDLLVHVDNSCMA